MSLSTGCVLDVDDSAIESGISRDHNHHALTPTDCTTVRGKAGKGTLFNGTTSFVDCGNDSSLNITDAITIEAWVYNTGSINYEHVVGKRTSLDITQYGLIKSNADKIMFEYGKPGGGWRAVTGDDFPLNRWAHVAVTINGTAYNFYVYGESAGSGNLLTVTYSVDAPVYIGTYGSAGGPTFEQWNGKIDEVRIYNRALSATEIKRNYLSKAYLYVPHPVRIP